MNGIPYPLKTTDPEGRTLRLFTVNYWDVEGSQHSVHIYATDKFHASLMLEDLKRTAVLAPGQIDSIYKE